MEGGMDREELKRLTKEEISRRIREGVKAVIVLRTAYANEQVLEEEMTEHLAAGYRERTPSRRGERNGYYTRDLITPAGRIAQLRVPRDREGTFLTVRVAGRSPWSSRRCLWRGGGARRNLWPGGSLSATGTGLSGRWRCLPRVWGRP
jgi:Transposase and inactivated derivatives